MRAGLQTNTPLSTTPPAAVGAAAQVGSAQTAARADHVHAHGNQAGDSLHAVATTSAAGFMSAADKSKSDQQTWGYLDTSGTPANVSAGATIRHGKAQLAAGAVDLVISHPRLTLQAYVTAWVEGSTARTFWPFSYATGSVTFRTTNTTTLPVRWFIHAFGDET